MDDQTKQLPDRITRCSRYLGYHAFAAGPCFAKIQEAVRYRDVLKAAGVTWWPQDQPWPAAIDKATK